MNSKQRVHAALRRESVDRLPVFMWFHPQTAQRLARLLEIKSAIRRPDDLIHWRSAMACATVAPS